MSRDVEVRLAALPAAGRLRYETTLIVPAGTSGYAVEVREVTTGALGAAGPVDAAPSGAAIAAAAVPASRGRAVESTEVSIARARFLSPEAGVPASGSIRATWNKRDQRILRVTGGAGSSLELGVALDLSAGVTPERVAFARAATEEARRLLGPTDRIFRVDIGSTPRFLGGMRGGPGSLFTAMPAGPPENTAISDGVRYALDCFAGRADRAALIVLTDGYETVGQTDWREVERVARARAIPIFVVLTAGAKARRAVPLNMPAETEVLEVTRNADPARIALPETLNLETGDEARSQVASRVTVARLAAASGGAAFGLGAPGQAAAVWSDIEKVLVRLWMAEFEPSDPALDPQQAEVRSAGGRVLRPGA